MRKSQHDTSIRQTPRRTQRSGERAFAYNGLIDSGGHQKRAFEGGILVAKLPYNGTSVPNCCPSQRIVQSYAVRDERLIKLSEKRSAIEKGEYDIFHARARRQ